MNTLRNNVQLIGNLGAKPEIKILESGVKLAKFSIAISEKFTNTQGEKVEKTDWFNIIAWNKLAELAEMFLDKGKRIALSGKLSQRTWDDKEGNKRYATEIICNELMFLDSK